MFGKLGALASLLANPAKVQEEMKKFQASLGQVVAEGDAGAGAVKVKVNGRFEVISCQLAESPITAGNKEMLEDLIKAATTQALQKVRQQIAEESAKMFAGLGVPANMAGGLPGLFG